MIGSGLIAVGLAVIVCSPLWGQEPIERRRQLQQQVMQRFAENVRNQARLSDEHFERLRQVMRRSFEARNELQEREMQVWTALEGQMRPGVAADEDSLSVLLDALVEVQAARVEQARREQAAYAEFLTPVQRAQVTLSWRRLQMQIERLGRMGPMRRRP
ncbi:MAG: hypothetical protein ACE5PT_10445 [Gemmatimonadales bacterium]